jgi:hypothetical protein
MATNNANPLFDWLRQECLSINSQRFHIFDSLSIDDFSYKSGSDCVQLLGDYSDFSHEFGYARFFTDQQDAPELSVYPLKVYRRFTDKVGKTYLGFGFRGGKSFCFEEDVILSGGQSKVFQMRGKNFEESDNSFSVWLRKSYDLVKAKYSPTKWQKIINGPKPFTPEEMRIVEARKKFIWQHVGFADNGDAIFEVENRSAISLPFLSIGVQGKGGSILIGGVYLRVGAIPPNTKAEITQDCYKAQLSAANFEAFPKPDPIPEKREAYWEFGIPK